MSEKITAILKELRQQLQTLYGPRLVRMVLYGSQARGDAEADSDLDVLVVLKGPVRPGEEIARTSDLIASLSLEHGVVVSRSFVSVDRFEHEQSPFLLNVRREGVTV
jgi:uncharacterized protein